MPTCNQCGKSFTDWMELSKHIMGNKKTHKNRSSRKFAASYISKHSLSYKAQHEMPTRTPLMPGEKEKIDEAKESIRIELSGVNKIANIICPVKKCRAKSREALPIEYVDSPTAWRIEGRIAKVCIGCGKNQ